MNDLSLTMRLYGYLGLLPFIVLATLILANAADPEPWRSAFDSYSIVILAFMAGMYWPLTFCGQTSSHPTRLCTTAVILALIGWFALFLPPGARALILAGSFTLLYLIDRFVLHDFWPAFYLNLRLHLTLVVVACQLLTGFACYLMASD